METQSHALKKKTNQKKDYLWLHIFTEHLFRFHLTKIVLFQLYVLKTMFSESKRRISTKMNGLQIIWV